MTGRKSSWWFDDDDTPQGGAVDISGEWDDPTFEAVAQAEEEERVSLELDLEVLTAKQRFVVELAWGWRGERKHSLREIAELMSMNLSAVQKHYKAALRKLHEQVVS